MPFHCDDPRTDRWAIETLDELHPMGEDPQNELVEHVTTVSLKRNHQGPTIGDFLSDNYQAGTGGSSPLPVWSKDPRLQFQHVTTHQLCWQNNVLKLLIPTEKELWDAGYENAWLFRPPIVDCPKMLQAMVEEVDSSDADVDIETGIEYESIEHMVDEARKLDCDKIVNCSGLGAADICGDDQLIGARGILLHYDRNNCARRDSIKEGEFGPMIHDANILVEDAPWGSEEMPCYLIVRGNTILVGGSYLEGDSEPSIRESERTKLLKNAELVGIDTKKSQPIGEWTGFRPFRPTSRCEVDDHFDGIQENIQLVHSYGYGGSGWTVFVGCAKEATQLLLA